MSVASTHPDEALRVLVDALVITGPAERDALAGA